MIVLLLELFFMLYWLDSTFKQREHLLRESSTNVEHHGHIYIYISSVKRRLKLYSFFAMNRAFMGFLFFFFFVSFLFFSFLFSFSPILVRPRRRETVIQASWRTREMNKTIYTMLAFAMELPIMTLFTKFTMAVAGCSGSSSANTWHWLSDLCAGFLATNPKQRLERRNITIDYRRNYFLQTVKL